MHHSPSPDVYNALGQRVDHTWPGGEIDWLYHPDGSELGDFMPVPWNDWANQYFNLNGRPIAKYIGVSPNGEWPAETYFFHANALGSTSMITDWSGAVRQKELFYPYGQFWAYGGDVGSFRFASLRETFPFNESEVFMSQTRDHHSRLYRWMTPDPMAGDILNPQSLNRYGYVMNNPANFVDPLGLGADDFTGSIPGTCSDPLYRVSHAECPSSCGIYSVAWGCGIPPGPPYPGFPGGFPGGGGGTGGGNAQNQGGTTGRTFPDDGTLGPCNGDPTGCGSPPSFPWPGASAAGIFTIYVLVERPFGRNTKFVPDLSTQWDKLKIGFYWNPADQCLNDYYTGYHKGEWTFRNVNSVICSTHMTVNKTTGKEGGPA